MLASLVMVLASLPFAATDISVSPGDSIQAAIEAASDGDRVLVQPGTYVEQIDLLGKAIEVIGVAGADQTILDGGGVGPVVRFASGEGTATRLAGLTVTNGYATQGAGGLVASSGATPTVDACIIRNNGGKWGGGVSGSPVLRRCVIRNNTASLTHGGGVYGAPLMDHCIVVDNTSTSANGGGVYLTGATTVEDCIFIGNRAVFANSKGGAVYVGTSAPVTIRDSLMLGNSATGGVFTGVGGAIVAGAGTVIEGCVILDNTLSGASGTLGGAVYGPAAISNSIIRGNTEPQLSGGASVSYSNVEGSFTGVGNIDLAPLFVDAAGGDYHLLADSPCIDTGDPGVLDPDGSRSDMGCFPFETFYVRANTQPADWSDPSWPEVSATAGNARVGLQLLAGSEHAGRSYVVLAGLTGTTPGLDLPLGAHLPLNFDGFTSLVLANLNTPVFDGFLGNLDAEGRASATFDSLVPLGPATAGIDISLAWLLLSPKDVASNPVTLSIVP